MLPSMVTTTCAVAGPQGDSCPVELSVSVTLPADISFSDGAYVASNVVAFGKKMPEPELVQMPPVALPPTEPPRPAVSLPAVIVWLPPALAVGAGLGLTVT